MSTNILIIDMLLPEDETSFNDQDNWAIMNNILITEKFDLFGYIDWLLWDKYCGFWKKNIITTLICILEPEVWPDGGTWDHD